MREVLADPAAARARGERAATDIARTHSLAAAGASMKRRLDELAARVELGARELASLAEPVDPTPRPASGGGWRGRVRRAVGRRVRRAIEEDLVALRESVHSLHRAVAGVDLVAVEAANDAAATQAATLAALRRFELGGTAEGSGERSAPPPVARPPGQRGGASVGGDGEPAAPAPASSQGPASATAPPPVSAPGPVSAPVPAPAVEERHARA